MGQGRKMKSIKDMWFLLKAIAISPLHIHAHTYIFVHILEHLILSSQKCIFESEHLNSPLESKWVITGMISFSHIGMYYQNPMLTMSISGACRKTFTNTCAKKGHMEQCPQHPDKWSLPGHECASCRNVRQAAERAAKSKKVKK